MTVKTLIAAGHLRLMMTSDLAEAYELSSAAGWNQTREDWRMLLEISPQGCFGIEIDGKLAATTTVVCYEKQLAWIGMVLTKNEYRGRGFARRLLAYALEFVDSLDIETVKLDATEQGKPLYIKFGFHAEQPVERWSRAGGASTISLATESKVNSGAPGGLLDLDRQAFVADRGALLKALTRRSAAYRTSTGFVFTRPGRATHYLGPCVASDSEAARKFIAEALSKTPDASWSWDLLPQNGDAVALAKEFGFFPQRHLTRMARGKPWRGNENMIYAIAGFELG